MNSALIYDVDDNFLKEAIGKLTDEEIELLIAGIPVNFSEAHRDNVKISRDWKNGFELFQGLCKLIGDELFTVSDDDGFPKAKAFWKKYNLGTKTIGMVVFQYLKPKYSNTHYKEYHPSGDDGGDD